LAGSDDLIGRIEARLEREPETGPPGHGAKPDWQPQRPFDGPPVAAAVLIGLVQRPSGLSVLYTERSPGLRSHSGQIAFPGGKIDADDSDAAAAALREAEEEVALERSDARVLGFLPRYFSGSNYLITPVVALIDPQRPFVPNPAEVKSLFEVPLEWLVDARNYGTFRVRRGGEEHTTWQITHGDFVIWGITANLTRRFHDVALVPEGVA
jgi:8-oxo-dGTP pyrophosphatase MutT (NUDIX family)